VSTEVQPTPGVPVQQQDQQIESWRGVAAEHVDLDAAGGRFVKSRSRRLLGQLLRPHKSWIIVLIAVVLVENGARLSIPKLVQHGIDAGVPPLVAGAGGNELFKTLGLMLGAVMFQAVARVIFIRGSGQVGQNVLLELRRRLFRHFQKLDVKFHDKYTSGRVVSRLTNDIDAIAELLLNGFDGLITAMLTMVGVGVLLLTLDLRLGAICLLSFPVLMLLVRWFSLNSTKTYRRVREVAALVIVHFVETMTGIRAVQSYRREPRNQEIFTDVSTRYSEANIKSFRLMAIFMPGVRLVGNITIGLVVLIGGWFVISGDMTVGVLAAFLLYLRMFFEPMQEISQFYNTFQSATSALEKLSGVLEEQPTVVEAKNPVPVPHARGAMTFGRVEFSYVDGTMVLPGLDLEIPAGQTVALVGTTGAGKTTIAKLMARFYDPSGGAVTLDGVDLRSVSDEDLRRAVVMVTQENFMFSGSVADNIAFGKPNAGREEIIAAGKAVGADQFIRLLPEGYDTNTGKRGGRFSAGQKQLIAFARAFLADPAVLILDEATSSLDVPTERLVQQALETVLKDRTAVIIAHRLSTVEIADRVLVLEHGRVIEDGSPADLIQSTGGRYAALHEAWQHSLA